MNRGGLIILMIGGAAGSRPFSLLAQDLTVEAGGLHARYADSVSGTAGHVGMRLDLVSRRASATLDAGLSRFTSGETVSQVAGRGSVFATSSRRFALGLQWGAEWDQLGSDTWVGTASVGPLVGLGSDVFTAAAGGAVGGLRRLDGSSLTIGSAGLMVEARVTEALAIQAAGNVTMSDTAAYADFTATLQARHQGLSLFLFGGARAGDLSDDPWGQVRVHYIFASWAAVEGAAGRYPRDLMGFTDGAFGTLGIRLSLLGSVRAPGVTKPTTVPPPPLRVDAMPDGQRRITVRYAHAVRQQLEIAGNWNGWMPVPLERGGRDTWSVVLRLTPGLYQYQLIVDGDTWTIPDGAPWVPDEFGGRVGLMVVRQEVGSGE